MGSDLLHKFIFIDRDEYVQSGEIVGTACDHVYLVKLDADPAPNANPQVSILISVSDMVESEACFIFDSRDEMETWIAWLDRGDKDEQPVVSVKH